MTQKPFTTNNCKCKFCGKPSSPPDPPKDEICVDCRDYFNGKQPKKTKGTRLGWPYLRDLKPVTQTPETLKGNIINFDR